MNNNIWNAWTSPMACKKSWVHHQHPPFKMQKSFTLTSFFMCEFHQLLLFYAIVGAAVESMTDETLKLLSFKVSYVVCMKAKEWIKMTSNACCLFFLYIYICCLTITVAWAKHHHRRMRGQRRRRKRESTWSESLFIFVWVLC